MVDYHEDMESIIGTAMAAEVIPETGDLSIEMREPVFPTEPIRVPRHVYDHLVAAGIRPEGIEPIEPPSGVNPNIDLIEANCAARSGVPVRRETLDRLIGR